MTAWRSALSHPLASFMPPQSQRPRAFILTTPSDTSLSPRRQMRLSSGQAAEMWGLERLSRHMCKSVIKYVIRQMMQGRSIVLLCCGRRGSRVLKILWLPCISHRPRALIGRARQINSRREAWLADGMISPLKPPPTNLIPVYLFTNRSISRINHINEATALTARP